MFLSVTDHPILLSPVGPLSFHSLMSVPYSRLSNVTDAFEKLIAFVTADVDLFIILMSITNWWVNHIKLIVMLSLLHHFLPMTSHIHPLVDSITDIPTSEV